MAIAALAGAAPLNDFMAQPAERRSALRAALSDHLAEGAADQEKSTTCLLPQAQAEYALPARVENFSDFYSSLNHAANVGRLFRPDNPVLPNPRWLPVGYHGRTSSICISGENLKRPVGQIKRPGQDTPTFEPCKRLDYEAELGILVGRGNDLGAAVDIDDAENHIFGLCLLNDWSARDIQSWEYQPLGPFLAKSFFTSLSSWIVTLEALEPYRHGWQRPVGDPEPLPHLLGKHTAQRGSIDIRIQVFLQTQRMREAGQSEVLISTSRFTDAYWTMSQLLAHQTSNGCNLRPGDLLGSGTLSGPEPSSRACLLELTQGGQQPITLPGGEERTFLQDGDTVVMRAYCEQPGRVRIGFGECKATVMSARQL